MNERPFNHAGFRQYLQDGRLMGARCTNCGQVYLPPRPMCPRCYQTGMEWHALTGRGVLEGVTYIHVGLPEMAAQGFTRERPYCSGVVRLDEGPAISGQIVGELTDHPGEVRVGMPVRAVFLNRDGVPALGFKLINK